MMPTAHPKSKSTYVLSSCILLSSMLALPAAWSQQKQGDGQVRALQQRLRAAEQEKSQLAAESAELDKKAKGSEARLAQSRRAAEAAERQRLALAKDLETASSEKSALVEQFAQSQRELAELRNQLAAVQGGLDRTQGLLGRSEMQRQEQERALAERIETLAECTARNDDLYQTAAGLLADLGVQGLGRPSAGQPMTLLARVAVENKMEEYRERMDRAQFAPALQRRHETEQRQAAQRRMAAEAEERTRLEQANSERQKAAREKARQQSELDKLTRRMRNFFEGIEW
ncbi:MAG: hypothetical protein WCT47_13390 [Betaproteobacteria bacterium]|jgi:DNA repair exonuclease SbcCD ATPase subunit